MYADAGSQLLTPPAAHPPTRPPECFRRSMHAVDHMYVPRQVLRLPHYSDCLLLVLWFVFYYVSTPAPRMLPATRDGPPSSRFVMNIISSVWLTIARGEDSLEKGIAKAGRAQSITVEELRDEMDEYIAAAHGVENLGESLPNFEQV